MTDYSAKAREIAEEIMREFHDSGRPFGGDKTYIELLHKHIAQALTTAHLSGYEQAKFDIATWHLKQSIAAHEADFYTLAEQHIEYAEKIRFFQQPSNKE